nr:MAG TPA: acyl-CoA thioester hydrolase [Caudoviricetes sp.]
MQKVRIDFDNPGLPQHISAVENDSQSRFFQATLYENGKAYTAPEGAAYSIMYHGFGPQNQGWYDTINDGAGKRAACAVSGNVVTCEIARQALQVPGHVSIVLCVTTGKGYMLKSWPIECDCKNDRYDSTVEIQSFFYVTQISNESWMQAIQAVEELKNIIDPTLSLSGKAAEAAKVGEAINAESERAKEAENQIKEDLDDAIGKPLKVEANKNADLIVTSSTNVYLLNFDNVIKSADSVKIRVTTNDKNSGSPLKIYITEKTDTNKCIVLEIIERNFIDTSFEEVVEISNYSNVVVGLAGAILYTNKTDKPGASALPKMVGETLDVYLSEDFNIAYNASVFAQFDLEQMNRDAKNNKNVVTVSHDGSKMFKSITEAVTYAKTIASKTNPITIIVYPGIYNEKIIIHNSYISIIGTNKQYCIIMNDKGDYDNAPIFASGNFYISNLTIKATHDGTPNFVENRTDDYKIGAYGIHIDDSNYANTDEKIGTVENCIIYSAQNQAIGIGMAKNCKYIIRNCTLINDSPDRMYELYTRPLKTGALGCHRGYFDGNSFYQILEVSNCILKVNKGVSIQLGPFKTSSTGMEEHFYNNMLWSGTLGKDNSAIGTYPESTYTTYELAEDCYGNNVSALNE